MTLIKERALAIFRNAELQGEIHGDAQGIPRSVRSQWPFWRCGRPIDDGRHSVPRACFRAAATSVLVELDVSIPTRGLFVLTADLDRIDQVIDSWITSNPLPLRKTLAE